MNDGSGFIFGVVIGYVVATLFALIYVPRLPWVIERNNRPTMKEAYDRGYADAVITDDGKVQFKWKEARK